MATEDEILSSRIIGFIEPLTYVGEDNIASSHTTILGFKNSEGEYVVLNKQKARNIFQPDGTVFAGSFRFYKEGSNIAPNSFVEFSVTPNPNELTVERNKYVMDYNQKMFPKSFMSIINVTYQTSLEAGFITQDELNVCVNKSIFKEHDTYFMLRVGEYLYGRFKYEKSSDSIRPEKGKEINEYLIDPENYHQNCVQINNKEYFIGSWNNLPFKQTRVIDCMDDAQLGVWFKELLKTASESESLLSLKKETFQSFAEKFKETNDIIEEVRLKRIQGKLDSLEYTYGDLKDMMEINSPLYENLNLTLKNMKGEFNKTWAASLETEKEELNAEVGDLEKKKQNLKIEYESLDRKYKEKLEKTETLFKGKTSEIEKKYKETEEKYNSIKKDFNAIIEQIKIQTQIQASTSLDNQYKVLVFMDFPAEGKTYTELEEEEGVGFSNILKKNIALEEIPEVLKNQLEKNSTLFSQVSLFIPSISWAILYAKAIRNSKLFIIHVEHDWLHYSDFMKNGLQEVLNSCYENETINHILVFDSLNLTQPECGLKPLLDVIDGYSLLIPDVNKPLPVNLKIFATILPFKDENKIGLKLNVNSFSTWGTIAIPDTKISLPRDYIISTKPIGFFEPKDLVVEKNNKVEKSEGNQYFN